MSVISTPPKLTSSGVTTPPPKGGPSPWRCTREMYRQLGEAGFFREKRYQLIRGEIIDMGDQTPRHFTMVAVLVEVLKAAFGSEFHIRQGGPLGFDDSEPEPDAAVVRGSLRDYFDEHPATALLAVEVSVTTLTYDLTTKVELYATAGIPEYWVVDLDGKQLHVFRDPAPLAEGLEATTYNIHLTFGSGESVTPLHTANPVKISDLLP